MTSRLQTFLIVLLLTSAISLLHVGMLMHILKSPNAPASCSCSKTVSFNQNQTSSSTEKKEKPMEEYCSHSNVIQSIKMDAYSRKSVSTSQCSSTDVSWIRLSHGRIFMSPEVKNCHYLEILRANDFSYRFTYWKLIQNGSLVPSFGIIVRCQNASNSSQAFAQTFHPIPLNKQFSSPANNTKTDQRNNIIIIGIDSVSRLEALRSLPKSYKFMTETLQGVPLLKYNVLGDGTPSALQPILTGRVEGDWPESRRGFPNATTVDGQDWIFKCLHQIGYLTLWGEEQPFYGTFQYRLHGFKDNPVHFNQRTTLLYQSQFLKNVVCIGGTTQSKRMLDNIEEMFQLYPNKPKFAFVFLSILSHDFYDISSVDEEFLSFLSWFHANALGKNSSLIFMSDHGHRYREGRNTLISKLEERLPLMTISLSSHLKQKLPQALDNLKHNARVLTTPYDLHNTLHDMAEPEGLSGDLEKFHWAESHSLIGRKLEQTRSCSDAKIGAHWCSCFTENPIAEPHNSAVVRRLARFAVASVNNLVSNHKKCAKLRLKSIIRASELVAEGELLETKRDAAGYIVGEKTSSSLEEAGKLFSVAFITLPNNATYEVTLTLHQVTSRKFLPAKDISRTNKYGKQPACISDKHPHLRGFCFCV